MPNIRFSSSIRLYRRRRPPRPVLSLCTIDVAEDGITAQAGGGERARARQDLRQAA